MPAKTKLRATAGPAWSAAAWPVSTKIPAPMMAPMPSVMRLTGPRERLSVFSPTSLASLVSVERGLVARSLGIGQEHPPVKVLCVFYTVFPLPCPADDRDLPLRLRPD